VFSEYINGEVGLMSKNFSRQVTISFGKSLFADVTFTMASISFFDLALSLNVSNFRFPVTLASPLEKENK
jgi:hypothetical protein